MNKLILSLIIFSVLFIMNVSAYTNLSSSLDFKYESRVKLVYEFAGSARIYEHRLFNTSLGNYSDVTEDYGTSGDGGGLSPITNMVDGDFNTQASSPFSCYTEDPTCGWCSGMAYENTSITEYYPNILEIKYGMNEGWVACGGHTRKMTYYLWNFTSNSYVQVHTLTFSNPTPFENLTYFNATLISNYVNSTLYLGHNSIIENSQIYNSLSQGNSPESFSINISYNPSFYSNLSGRLVYNGTEYNSSIINYPYDKILSSSLITPHVSVNANISFYWNISLTNSSGSTNYYKSNEYNQTIEPFSMDNCSSYTNRLFNFSLVDEKNQTTLTDGVNIQFYLTVYDSTKTNSISNLSFESNYSGTSICFNNNFTNTDNLSLDAQIRYTATGYEPEYYNIVNLVLNNQTIQRNITLYNILSAESTTFKVTLKDTSISPISNALIYVNRKYVSEGVFKTVEIPLTDSKGSVVVHLVNNDMPYQFIAIKDSVISTLEITPNCQVTPCTIEMSELSETGGVLSQYYDYFADNIISSLTYNKATKNITYVFVDTTATANYFRLVVNKVHFNQSGTEICNLYAYAMAGTLVCDLSNYEGDFIATTYISRSPELTDRILGVTIDSSVIEDLGIDMVFFNICLLIIIVTAAAIITKTPSGVIISFGLGITLLKIITIFPFNWVTVVSIDVLCLYLWRKVRQ